MYASFFSMQEYWCLCWIITDLSGDLQRQVVFPKIALTWESEDYGLQNPGLASPLLELLQLAKCTMLSLTLAFLGHCFTASLSRWLLLILPRSAHTWPSESCSQAWTECTLQLKPAVLTVRIYAVSSFPAYRTLSYASLAMRSLSTGSFTFICPAPSKCLAHGQCPTCL